MKKIVGKTIGRFWLLFMALLAIYIFKISNRIKVRGKKNLPKGVNILFVSNHQTLIDSFLIGISVSSLLDIFFRYDRVPFNAPDFDNFYRHPLGEQIMEMSKCIPVHRRSIKRQVIDKDISGFCEALQESNLVLFFEGTRTRDGRIGDCKYGVAKTILIAKPKFIVPIYLHDIQAIMPIKSGFNFAKIYGGNKGEIYIGKPIIFSDPSNLEVIKLEIKEAVLKLEELAKEKGKKNKENKA